MNKLNLFVRDKDFRAFLIPLPGDQSPLPWRNHGTWPSIQSLRWSRIVRVLIQLLFVDRPIRVHILSWCVNSIYIFDQLLLVEAHYRWFGGIRVRRLRHQRRVLHHLPFIWLWQLLWISLPQLFRVFILFSNFISYLSFQTLEFNDIEGGSIGRALVPENILHSCVIPLSICSEVVRASHSNSFFLVNNCSSRALSQFLFFVFKVYV